MYMFGFGLCISTSEIYLMFRCFKFLCCPHILAISYFLFDGIKLTLFEISLQLQNCFHLNIFRDYFLIFNQLELLLSCSFK